MKSMFWQTISWGFPRGMAKVRGEKKRKRRKMRAERKQTGMRPMLMADSVKRGDEEARMDMVGMSEGTRGIYVGFSRT